MLYTGCGGNGNRFASKEECEHTCAADASVQQTPAKQKMAVDVHDVRHMSTDGTDVCTLNRAAGPCADAVEQWYFSPTHADCLPFTYGGCGGNGNRFDTKDECMAHCARRVRAAKLQIADEQRMGADALLAGLLQWPSYRHLHTTIRDGSVSS
jgi:hypothetical protein